MEEHRYVGLNNYCLNCWIDFTTMTPEEHSNYQKMLEQARESCKSKSTKRAIIPISHNKNDKQGIDIVCNETQIIYKSISACARAIGSNVCTMSRHLAFGHPAKVKGYTFSYI